MEKDITVDEFLKRIKLLSDLNKNKESFRNADFETIVTILNRNGYHTSYYNEDYEFVLYFTADSVFSNNLIDKNKSYSMVYYIFYNSYGIEINLYYGTEKCDPDIIAYIKNDEDKLLKRKILYSHFSKNDFIKLINSAMEFIKVYNLNIIEHEIVVNDWRLVFKDVEELKNSTFDFRNLIC